MRMQIPVTKAEFREEARQRKRFYTAQELREISQPLIRRLLELTQVRQAETIMLYSSLPDEVDTHEAIECLYHEGKRIVLPTVTGDTEMELCEYSGDKDLRKGRYGILEPCGKRFSDYSKISVAIVPGMAFDREGNRLGRGKGYYDRFLSKLSGAQAKNIAAETFDRKRPYLIGICFPFQLFNKIPADSQDIKMDMLIAE